MVNFIPPCLVRANIRRAAMMSEIKAMIPDPWSQTQQPHKQSTRLSRFRANAMITGA